MPIGRRQPTSQPAGKQAAQSEHGLAMVGETGSWNELKPETKRKARTRNSSRQQRHSQTGNRVQRDGDAMGSWDGMGWDGWVGESGNGPGRNSPTGVGGRMRGKGRNSRAALSDGCDTSRWWQADGEIDWGGSG